MRNLLISSTALCALILAAPASQAGTYLPIVPVPNSSSTNVFGINDGDDITGSFISSNDGLEHGYTGPVDGSNYTTFDAPAGSTEPRAIANDGTITGFGNNDGTPEDFQPFERYPKGKLVNVVNSKGKPLNYIAQGLANSTDKFAGSYFNKSLVVKGYLGKKGVLVKGVKLSITNLGVAPRGVNSNGDIVGWYFDSNGVQNGFLISGGVASTIDYPDATETYSVLEGINDKGKITGQWGDTNGVVHAFTYDTGTGNFKSIDVPGAASFSQAWGINTAGDVAIGSDVGYFIYCPGKSCPFTGIRGVEKEISVPLKGMPHVPCVNSCLSPLSQEDLRDIAQGHGGTGAAPANSGRPEPLQP